VTFGALPLVTSDAGELARVGLQSFPDGTILRLRNCPCGSTLSQQVCGPVSDAEIELGLEIAGALG
jgi:hypothetical protein